MRAMAGATARSARTSPLLAGSPAEQAARGASGRPGPEVPGSAIRRRAGPVPQLARPGAAGGEGGLAGVGAAGGGGGGGGGGQETEGGGGHLPRGGGGGAGGGGGPRGGEGRAGA